MNPARRRTPTQARHLAWLLLALAPAAVACGLVGVVDQVSSDGQSITSRRLVALREQAQRHGGYERAALELQRRRDELMRSALSPRIRQRLERDYSRNIGLLTCWSRRCAARPDEPDCQLQDP